MTNQHATIKRSIWFYRVVNLNEDDPDWKFNPKPLLTAVHSLPFERNDASPPGRLVEYSDVANLCAWVDTASARGRLRFGTVRTDALPVAVLGANRRPINLNPQEGLLEETHIQFFDHNIAGAVFNFHAPRISSLIHYFKETIDAVPDGLRFQRLGIPDMMETAESNARIHINRTGCSLPLHRCS